MVAIVAGILALLLVGAVYGLANRQKNEIDK